MDQTALRDARLIVCHRCHQPNLAPPAAPRRARLVCDRCRSALRPFTVSLHNNRLAAIFALFGLLFFLPAVTLPIMGVRRFGLVHEYGLIEGATSLIHAGNLWLGLVVLVCSVFLPIGKLVGLLLLSTRGPRIGAAKRSLLFHIIEWTGRFGFLDVMLVAVLIAALKVGDLVTVYMGPGLTAFALVVSLSLLSSWAFDTDSIWSQTREQRG